MTEKNGTANLCNGEANEPTELIPLHQANEVDDSMAEPLNSKTGERSLANSTETVIDADIAEFIPSPPDGGWGWVIVLSSFMNHFILDGIAYAFGSLMLEYRDYFQSSAASTSALMSTLIGCYMLSAPVASALINKFGCRPVGIAGSLLAALSFLVCTFAESIEAMIFLFGVCGGVGFGLMYMPAVISVSLYFEKKRPMAVGIGMCGTGVGTFVFGPTAKFLLDIMDWKGTHFIFAGIILHGAFFAALIRPLETEYDRKVRREKRLAKKNKDAAKHSMNNIQKVDKDVDKESAAHSAFKPVTKPAVKNVMTSHPNMRTAAHGSRLNVDSINLYHSTTRIGSSKMVTKISADEAQDLKRPLYRKDIFYSGSVFNLPEFKETSTVKDYMASITSIPAMREEHGEMSPTTFRFSCLPRQIADALSEMLDFSLLKTPSFNLVTFLSLIIMLAYLIPFAFTSVRAENLGIKKVEASLLISVLGLSTMLGRLISSLIASIPRVRPIVIHNIFLFLAGVSTAAMPFCTTYVPMAVSAFCYGLFMGGHVALSPIILVDLIGLDKLTTAYGIMTLVRGISTMMGPPLAGKLYDQFNSYDIAFYVAGGLIITSTMGFFLLELKWFQKKSPEDKK